MAKGLADRLGLGDAFPYNDFEEVIDDQLKQLGSSIEDINKKGGVLKKKYCKPKMKFKTPTGKVELCLIKAEGSRIQLHRLSFVEPKSAPEGYFRLITGLAAQHTFSRTINNQMLHEVYPENALQGQS